MSNGLRMTPNLAKAEPPITLAELEQAGFYFIDESAETMLRALKDQCEAWLERLPHIRPTKVQRNTDREMQALKTALTCAKSALDDLTA